MLNQAWNPGKTKCEDTITQGVLAHNVSSENGAGSFDSFVVHGRFFASMDCGARCSIGLRGEDSNNRKVCLVEYGASDEYKRLYAIYLEKNMFFGGDGGFDGKEEEKFVPSSHLPKSHAFSPSRHSRTVFWYTYCVLAIYQATCSYFSLELVLFVLIDSNNPKLLFPYLNSTGRSARNTHPENLKSTEFQLKSFESRYLRVVVSRKKKRGSKWYLLTVELCQISWEIQSHYMRLLRQ